MAFNKKASLMCPSANDFVNRALSAITKRRSTGTRLQSFVMNLYILLEGWSQLLPFNINSILSYRKLKNIREKIIEHCNTQTESCEIQLE